MQNFSISYLILKVIFQFQELSDIIFAYDMK